MIDGKWFITPHAVNQYKARYHRKVSYSRALGGLIAFSEKARFVKVLHDGVELWRTGKPHRLRMVVSSRLVDRKQLVTVLKGSGR